MRPATLIGTVLVCTLGSSAAPLAAQSSWNAVATRGDADREATIIRASYSLYRERDCRGARQQIRQAAEWYETRPGVDPDPRIPLIAARTDACLGDTVSAAINFGIYDALGGKDPDLAQEFGDVCRALFGPSEMPVDSLEAVQTMRELREDSLRLEGAVVRARPGITRDSVWGRSAPEPERTIQVRARNSVDFEEKARISDINTLPRGQWRKSGGEPTGSRREVHRLVDELNRVDAQMACLRAAW